MALFDDVQRKVLDNGLEILVREDRSSPVAALNFFVRVGSLNEDDAIAGWSHGIEHMLFKGTGRRGPGDIAREIQDAGGETNAGTGYESTNYYITLPSENVETAIDIHADVLRHSTFDEFELEKERQVLIKENAMYRDRPTGYGFTWEGLLAEAFTAHRYRRPIGGPDENLLRVGRDSIVAFKERYYVPNNITYVVVGDVDAGAVFRLLEEKLGGWPRRPLDPDRSPAEPPQAEFRFRRSEGDVEKAYVKIGFHVPPELDPDTDALLVLAHVLGSGRASRLYRRVREEQGLILGSSILQTTGKDPGYLVVEFTAEPAKAEAALESVLAEVLRFRREPVRPEELGRTLKAVRGDTLYTLETMEGQASMLGHYALLGDHRLAGTYLDRVSRVTPARLQEAARSHLGLDRATVFAYVPRSRPAFGKEGNGAPVPVGELRSRLAPVGEDDADPVPAPDTPVRERVPSASGTPRGEVEAITLDTGTRVLLQPDGRIPLVALAAYSPVGSGTEPAASAGVTRLTGICMLKGAGGRSAHEIAEALENLGARLRPFTSRDVSGFSLSAVRSDLSPALDLFQTVLAAPAFPEPAVARERERTLSQIASRRDNTLQYTVSELFRHLYAGHAYAVPVEGDEESVRRLSRDALLERHRTAFGASSLVVGVVGDFERDPLLRRLEALLSALPSGGEPAPVAPLGSPAPALRRDLAKEVAQAVVVAGCPGPASDSPDRYALDVWNHVMSGMGNRLFTRLRDERHLCYYTGTFVAPLRRGGVIGAYVGTGPEQVEEALAGLREELALSLREPPTEEEVVRARNTIAGSHLVDLQTRMTWAASLAQDEIQGLGYEETFRYVDEIRKVTAVQAMEAAARYVDDARLSVTVLGPEEAGRG